MKRTLALIAGTLVSLGANAELPLDFHVSGQAAYTQIKAAGEKFSPKLFHLKADVEFTDTFMDGIGLQGVVGVPISDDQNDNLTLEVKQQSAIYVTLTDPTIEPGDLRFSLLIGYASTEIETELATLGSKNKDTFSGTSYGFTLQDLVAGTKSLYWTLDFNRFYKDDDLRVDSVGLGVTYAF